MPAVEKPKRKLKAVVVGGGTGAPVSIRTLLSMGVATNAVVAMADDGGSTGILRDLAGATAPGDIRKCILAMASDPGDPVTRALKCRFEFAGNHSLGNLLLAALEDVTGSFPEAIATCENLVNARGKVYPSTLDKVMITATTKSGNVIRGQARACHSQETLSHVQLESEEPVKAYGPALEAIKQADLIVLGPGSLFTSIIPNLLVPGIIDAIRQSHALTVFVCPLADQQGETRGMTAIEHYQALVDHGMGGLIHYMVVHSAEPLKPETPMERASRPLGEGADDGRRVPNAGGDAPVAVPVKISYEDAVAIQQQGVVVIVRNLVDPNLPTWHDPIELRSAFKSIIELSRSQASRMWNPSVLKGR
jgi:uncharacterized cofD-like protein